ncbi:hypothetical protein DEO72_LG1g3206 [Vigna unguiculata]|uniref:Uncharacterized protein n=1 Tax=Vigna unguiculata TaxID=3917 RepID=A0A4D6KZH8_VIGUN|nr:hypothetical protein DEO72_LG1g3206 [Vigna unguiculata]
MKVLVRKSFELVRFCTWPRLSVHHGIEVYKRQVDGLVAYKCPQMNTMKVLVRKSFELVRFCTWPRLSVHHGIGRLLGGEFSEKMKFVVFER